MREIGRALTELESALIEAGVEETSAAEFVDDVETQALELAGTAKEDDSSEDGDESK